MKDLHELAEYLENIAEKHKDLLPLILGKWDFWKEAGIEQLILEQLKKALEKTQYPLFLYLDDSFLNSSPFFKGEMPTENKILRMNKKLFGSSKFEEKRAVNLENVFKSRRQCISALVELTQHNFYEKVFVENWDNKLELAIKRIKGENTDQSVDGVEKFKNFLEVLMKDKDLSSFIDSYYLQKRREYENYLKNIKEWNTFWISLKTNK